MPAVGAFAGVLAALVILLLLIAAWVIAEILARTLSHVPLVGGWIGSEIRALVAVAGAGILAEYDSATADAGWLFAAISAWAWQHLYSTDRAIANAIGLGIQGVNDAITALGQIGSAVASAEHTAIYSAEVWAQAQDGLWVHELSGLISGVATDLDNAAASLQANLNAVDNRLGSAIAAAMAAASTAEGILARDILTIEQTLTGDVTSIVGQITAGLAQATAEANAAAAAAEHAAIAAATTLSATAAAGAVGLLDQAAHDLVIGPWQVLIGELAPVIADLPADVARVLGFPGTLAPALPDTIPGVLSWVVPAIGAIGAEVARCLVGRCDSLGEIDGLLKALQDTTLWALFLAALIETVHDPAAVVSDLAGPVNDIVLPVYSALIDLIGL